MSLAVSTSCAADGDCPARGSIRGASLTGTAWVKFSPAQVRKSGFLPGFGRWTCWGAAFPWWSCACCGFGALFWPLNVADVLLSLIGLPPLRHNRTHGSAALKREGSLSSCSILIGRTLPPNHPATAQGLAGLPPASFSSWSKRNCALGHFLVSSRGRGCGGALSPPSCHWPVRLPPTGRAFSLGGALRAKCVLIRSIGRRGSRSCRPARLPAGRGSCPS